MRVGVRALHLLIVAALILAACGGDGGDGGNEGGESPTTAPASNEEAPETTEADTTESDAMEEAEEMAEDLAEDLEETQEAVGGGSATLTVGDQTWTFDSVLCAFGEDEIGQEGAVFNLSAIQDGLQLYASIDSFGHSVTLDDIEDFENPSVALEAGGPIASLTGGEEEFIELDGKNVSAAAAFVDNTTDEIETTEGTLEATCP